MQERRLFGGLPSPDHHGHQSIVTNHSMIHPCLFRPSTRLDLPALLSVGKSQCNKKKKADRRRTRRGAGLDRQREALLASPVTATRLADDEIKQYKIHTPGTERPWTVRDERCNVATALYRFKYSCGPAPYKPCCRFGTPLHRLMVGSWNVDRRSAIRGIEGEDCSVVLFGDSFCTRDNLAGPMMMVIIIILL